jgi:hypothetical protein
MTGYLIFFGLILIFVVVFLLLWKKRKNKNADINQDPWKDVANYNPDDTIL